MFVSKTLAFFALAATANAVAIPVNLATADAQSSPSYMSGVQTGDATWYQTGLGACGVVNKNTDFIAAVSHSLFDTYPGYSDGNPNDNPVCGKKINMHYGGKSVAVEVTDRCTGCATTSLDLSPSAFQHLASESAGRLHGMTWEWA